MICCLESPFTDAKTSYYSQVATDEKLLPDEDKKKEQGGSSSSSLLYPGLRRTPHGPPAAPAAPAPGLISVTVPPGVLPGQEIHVRRPDGNGLVEVVVPSGMTEGSVFHVRAPPPVVAEDSSNPQHSVNQYNPPTVATNNTSAATKGGFADCLNDNTNQRLPPNNTTTSIRSNHHPAPTTTTWNGPNVSSSSSSPGKALMRVQVPPGMEPGTTILVAIPNEPGRHVQAQIPPNVQQFLVEYEPATTTTTTTTARRGVKNANENDDTAVLPIIGGIATGVAAVMAYEHYS